MENVYSERQRRISGKIKESQELDKDRPEIKDLGKEYLKEIKELSQAQKINLLYSSSVGKNPGPHLSVEQRLTRILYEVKFGAKIKDTEKFLKKKKGKFKWPRKWWKTIKNSNKKRNQILVIFLNIKGEVEPPRLYPIYSSNMVIIRNRPYEVDPRSFWRLGKYTCQIIKGIDRRPVSNLDYNEIKIRGDSTDSDEFLIKAAMNAMAGGLKKKPVSKGVIVMVGIAVLASLVFFMSK